MEAVSMRTRRSINTTLGELIAAVTDEVMPLAENQANADALVSYIVNDLLIAKRVRLKKRTTLRAAS
jgi:hypothetical protein